MNKLSLFAFILAAASLGHGQTVLPNLNSDFNTSAPNAINDSGIVVGGGIDSDGNFAPLLWENGTVVELENLGMGEARAINNTGDAVGWTYDGNTRFPALWIGEVGTILPDLGFGGEAFDINESGVIVGSVLGPNFQPLAARWVDGELELLERSPLNLSYGVAQSINDSGVIVGQGDFGIVRWTGDVVDFISPTSGFGFASNIANDGFIGATFIPGFVQPIRVAPDTSVTVLPTLSPFVYGRVLGGNAGATLVGDSWQAENRYRATAWTEAGFEFLDELPNALSSSATGANNIGSVTGYVDLTSGRIPVIWQINPLPVTVTPSAEAGKVGELIAFDATVTRAGNPVAGESVTFRLGSRDLGTSVTGADGTAMLSARIPVTTLPGDTTLTATTAGGRLGQSTVAVTRGNSTLTSGSATGLPGRAVAIAAFLTNAHSGAPLGQQRVMFAGPGRMFTASTASNGRVQIGYRIPATAQPGSVITFDLMYSGGTSHTRSMGRFTITVQ